MTRSNAFALCVLLLALAAMSNQTGWAQAPATNPMADKPADTGKVTCKMYSLADLVGDDATFGNWIADTILNMIEPDSWTFDGNYRPLNGGDKKSRRGLSYHGPTKLLAVYHTPAVHAKVDEFLKELKKTSARAKATKPAPIAPSVQQAQFAPAAEVAPRPMPTQALGYPVAGPLQQPKHLFHFIIRYEGDGILDANVVKFAKAIQAAAKSDSASSIVTLPSPQFLQHPPSYQYQAASDQAPSGTTAPVAVRAMPPAETKPAMTP